MKKTIKYANSNSKNATLYESPFDLELVREDGTPQKFFTTRAAKGETLFEKITLKDLVNYQVESMVELFNARNASSGDYARNASSGHNARNASSGDYVRNASSGFNARNASSGDYARNASSGDYARNASSGYNARNASSGDCAQNASSGDYARNASSGFNARNASSGDYARNASSGDYARNASSGDYARNASSGFNARNASSGDYAQNASSGHNARNECIGENSIVFACGIKNVIKATTGTWIALAEYHTKKTTNETAPFFAKTAQIGNKDYLDCDGNILNENHYYFLSKKEFVPFIYIDGLMTYFKRKRTMGEAVIWKGNLIKETESGFDIGEEVFVIQQGEYYAHGRTLKDARRDLNFKLLSDVGVEEVVERIKKENKMTAVDYRLITKSCFAGTEHFLKQHNYTWEDEKTPEEVIELTKGQWGHSTLVEVLKKGN